MWTVKRIVMLVTSFAVHVAGYASYAFFLGNIDALPQLPEKWWPKTIGPIEDPPEEGPEVDRRGCEHAEVVAGGRRVRDEGGRRRCSEKDVVRCCTQ